MRKLELFRRVLLILGAVLITGALLHGLVSAVQRNGGFDINYGEGQK